MSEFDVVIRGGTVVTAADTVRADVGIRSGKIIAVAGSHFLQHNIELAPGFFEVTLPNGQQTLLAKV